MTLPTRRGVYFLANDAVGDLVIAFLNSFRRFNPDIALCLVPFNDSFDKIARLDGEYGFSVWNKSAPLHACDEISEKFHGRVVGHYRKLAMWEGDYDEFVYIDVDTVVLESIDGVFPFLGAFDILTSESHVPEGLKWVWKDSIFDAGVLSPKQIRYAANTGFIASRRGALTLAEGEEKVPLALGLSPHMVLFCQEQPFLNYLIVTSGKRYSSLIMQARITRRLDIPIGLWGGRVLGPLKDGRIVSPPYPSIMLVHWAGVGSDAAQGTMPNQELWNYYRNLRRDGRGDACRGAQQPGNPSATSSAPLRSP